jgi:hypothetical protein
MRGSYNPVKGIGMTVTLAPETEAKARRLAAREDKSRDAMVNEILDEVLDLPRVLVDSPADTVMPDSTNGTGKPRSVCVEEPRRKYGYPDESPSQGSTSEVQPSIFVPADR